MHELMGSLRLNLPRPGRPAAEILRRLPPAFREDAERGFVLLANIPQDRYEILVRHTIVMMDSRRPPVDELTKTLGLTASETGSVVSAAMIVVPMFGEGTTADGVLEAATKVKLIDPSLVPKLKLFVDTVAANGPEIAAVIKRVALTDQVLPSFMTVDVAVDVRLGFAEGRVDVVAPVALIHIDTDRENEELWFQCSKQQLLLIREEVETALKKIDAAEAWAARS
jgi:hypothetical protein